MTKAWREQLTMTTIVCNDSNLHLNKAPTLLQKRRRGLNLLNGKRGEPIGSPAPF
jgi:hypothetical protein